jgi:hypothetical protein
LLNCLVFSSSEVQSGMTKRVAEMLGHSINEEVWVRAGVIYGVPLLVTAEDLTPQVNITWQFATDPNVSKNSQFFFMKQKL